jgi:hypothetical protein
VKRAVGLLLLIAACGKQGELMPKAPPGEAPKNDPAKPLPSTLLIRPTQAEPARVDDPLSRSQERRDDRFNLPPPG